MKKFTDTPLLPSEEEFKFFRISLTKLKNKIKQDDTTIIQPICDYCGSTNNLDLINFKCNNCEKSIKNFKYDNNIHVRFVHKGNFHLKKDKVKINPMPIKVEPKSNVIEQDSLCQCLII